MNAAAGVLWLFDQAQSSAGALFERWWKWVPRKVGRKAALREFERALKDGATVEQLMAGVQAWNRRDRHTDVRFIPHPRTWLHQGRWDDEDGVSVPEELVTVQARHAAGAPESLIAEWKRASDRLSAADGARYRAWFADLVLIGYDERETPVLQARSAFAAEYIRNHLDQALRSAWGRSVKVVPPT